MPGKVNCRSIEWANKIAANAPLAIQEMKRLFRHGLTQDFESHSHHVLMSVLMSVLNLFKRESLLRGSLYGWALNETIGY